MSIIVVGTSGDSSIEIAKKFPHVVIVTRTIGTTILEYAQSLKEVLIQNPTLTVIADDPSNEPFPKELVRPPMRESIPFTLEEFEERAQYRSYEQTYRAPKNTYSKYQKGRDKRNK